jgi:hypothetical protein
MLESPGLRTYINYEFHQFENGVLEDISADIWVWALFSVVGANCLRVDLAFLLIICLTEL